MRVAQRLYENGYITYMRTDSTTLSETALDARPAARPRELYGAEYVPDAPRRYDGKVKNAQEAHEAIRPAGDRFRTPGAGRRRAARRRVRALRADLEAHRRLADGRRRAARRSTVRLGATRADGRDAEFSASRHGHHVPRLPRGLRGGPRRRRAAATRREDASAACRSWPRATPLDRCSSCEPDGHATSPPPATPRRRWSRRWRSAASAARRRTPSIIGTILDRGYVVQDAARRWCRRGSRSRSIAAARAALRRLVDYDFTARDGGGPRPDRRRRRGARRRGCAASTSATAATARLRRVRATRRPARAGRRASATSTPARSTRSPIGDGHRRCGSAATARTSSDGRATARTRSAHRCPRTSRPTS